MWIIWHHVSAFNSFVKKLYPLWTGLAVNGSTAFVERAGTTSRFMATSAQQWSFPRPKQTAEDIIQTVGSDGCTQATTNQLSRLVSVSHGTTSPTPPNAHLVVASYCLSLQTFKLLPTVPANIARYRYTSKHISELDTGSKQKETVATMLRKITYTAL